MRIKDYRSMLISRHQAAQMGIPAMEPWPPDKAARLMAILQVFGNNEAFSFSPKFIEDCIYIKELYHLDGGEAPDADFIKAYPKWEKMYDAVKKDDDPIFKDAEKWIMQMYNFKIFV